MTTENTCATCDYFRAVVSSTQTHDSPPHAHGTCHIDPPGNSVRNGFPMVAATDWCAKGATAGEVWASQPSRDRQLEEMRLKQFEFQRNAAERAARIQLLVRQVEDCRKAGDTRAEALLSRNLWQRICNTVPWEGK